MKRKVDELYVHNLEPVPVDLNKLNNVVKKNVVQKDVYNAQIKNIENEIPSITNWATTTTLNDKINKVKSKTCNITNLATTTTLTAVEK